jgi:hypothetical protein
LSSTRLPPTIFSASAFCSFLSKLSDPSVSITSNIWPVLTSSVASGRAPGAS